MTGIDTNVLVRYLTRDDPEQYGAARRFLHARTPEDPGYINVVVLCELVWTLRAAYGADRVELARTIDLLLTTRQFVVERRDAVRAALRDFVEGQTGFADCLIARLNGEAGCRATATFDRRAAALPGMRLL